ncbi:MAG: carbohydrate kinase family protein [Lachnospiraceae bacterium]|nr:carbohydrate kinase family protein [Lachnospiraceae bacterium]
MNVLCVGLMVCDIMAKPFSAGILEKDHTKVNCIDMRVGGDAFNVAANLTALGTDNTLCSRVGRDHMGSFALKFAAAAGIGTEHILAGEKPTSVSLVMLEENGERHFASQDGASQFITGEEISDALLGEHDILYIGSLGDLPGLDRERLHALLKRAKEHGMLTAMDITGEPGPEAMDYLLPSLPMVDFFLPSDYEAMKIADCSTPREAAQKFADLGVKHVIVKQGAKGCSYLPKEGCGEYRSYPAFRTKAVDTTGAGDAFVAGFLSAYCGGFSIEECIAVALRVGAECVKSLGANVALKRMDEYAGQLEPAG